MGISDVKAHRDSQRVEVDWHHSKVGNAGCELDQVGVYVVVDRQPNQYSLVNENLDGRLVVHKLVCLENSIEEDFLLVLGDLHELRVVADDGLILTRVHFFVVGPV